MALEQSNPPATYHSVKVTLRRYAVIASGAVAIWLYFALTPAAERRSFEHLSSAWIKSPLIAAVGASTILVLLSAFVSWLAVFFFEVHDKIYDRFIVGWRRAYCVDVILPALTRPFGPNLDPDFYSVVQTRLYDTMKIYYDFVGDGERAEKITANLIVRFYEAITKYWVTQLNEILIIIATIIDIAFFFDYRWFHLNLEPVTITAFILIALFVVNQLARRFTLRFVRTATLDEIEDIHRNHLPALESRLRELHQTFGLKWRDQ